MDRFKLFEDTLKIDAVNGSGKVFEKGNLLNLRPSNLNLFQISFVV